jgi:DNA polymerase III alpha subunit
MYLINGNISRNYKRSEISKYHQIELVITKKGYQNLFKLTPLIHLIGWQGKRTFGRPCINKKMLYKYRKYIVLTSTCLSGYFFQNLLNGFFFNC